MEHNRMDYINDIVRPLKYFLRTHQFQMKPIKNLMKSPLLDEKLSKNVGYFDKKAIKFSKIFGIINKSQYYNNF